VAGGLLSKPARPEVVADLRIVSARLANQLDFHRESLGFGGRLGFPQDLLPRGQVVPVLVEVGGAGLRISLRGAAVAVIVYAASLTVFATVEWLQYWN
jgi:hypothetical protein